MKKSNIILIGFFLMMNIGFTQVKNENKLIYFNSIKNKPATLITISINGKNASFISFDFNLNDTLKIRDYDYDKMIREGYYYFLSSYTFSSLLTVGVKHGYYSDKKQAAEAFNLREKNIIPFDKEILYKSNKFTIRRIEITNFKIFLIDADILNQFEPIEALKSNYTNNLFLRIITPFK